MGIWRCSTWNPDFLGGEIWPLVLEACIRWFWRTSLLNFHVSEPLLVLPTTFQLNTNNSIAGYFTHSQSTPVMWWHQVDSSESARVYSSIRLDPGTSWKVRAKQGPKPLYHPLLGVGFKDSRCLPQTLSLNVLHGTAKQLLEQWSKLRLVGLDRGLYWYYSVISQLYRDYNRPLL